MGATEDGRKELIAISDGYRESTQSWRELLLAAKQRGLAVDPKLATGDGALGFWAALREVYPATREQRCWVHKTANVLNKLPKSIQAKAKSMLQEIWMAETHQQADTPRLTCSSQSFEAKYPKAVACLTKDRDVLLTFYDFPRRALGASSHDQPDRVDVRDGAFTHGSDQGLRQPDGMPDDGFQVGSDVLRNIGVVLTVPRLLPQVIQGVTFVDGLRKEAA